MGKLKFPDGLFLEAHVAGLTRAAAAAKIGCSTNIVGRRYQKFLRAGLIQPKLIYPDSNKLRLARQRGLTMAQTAAECGCSRATVSRHWKRLIRAGWARRKEREEL